MKKKLVVLKTTMLAFIGSFARTYIVVGPVVGELVFPIEYQLKFKHRVEDFFVPEW